MTRVFKYLVPIGDDVRVTMPAGGKVLHVALQNAQPTIWALVSDDALDEQRTFHWRGTGHDCDGLGSHLGTVLMYDGALVFHLFDSKGATS